MTRYFVLLTFLVVCANVLAQRNDVFSDTMNGNKEKRTYIKNKGETTSFYVLPRTDSNYDKSLEFFSPQKRRANDRHLDEELTDFKKRVPNIKKQQLGDMPRTWYYLIKHGDAYYVSNSDPIVLEFTDTLIMSYDIENLPWPLYEFKQLDGGGWSYKTIDYYGKERRETIIPCSKLKGAYLMTNIVEGELPKYSLWTNDKEVRNFDIIEWDDKENEPYGLPYEEIDFDSLR